ncbi:hypothetical protein ACIBL3_46960 [Kribbella sp. NPDC050124]
MKRIRINRRKVRRADRNADVWPDDPRDPDVLRAKALGSGPRYPKTTGRV